ncbi:conserved hypothetical protein [Planktothrix serta PCC 8927]|uniref:type I site-specific deoxyribonuclease n=1 Tax=Planktothrix serta PCC 8927 TaxID=671068 RepID=A0A7Z9E0G7_9CYAN|nr:type I restriction endonuclease [Planktothrix serta]VXD16572.1 conserved hypothetical protein [Planktothrix serta PCC 8927]
MNTLSQNTANRTRNPLESWLNFSKALEPNIERILNRFEGLGYTVLLQPDIISGRHQGILRSYCNGILGDRFRQAMQRINPEVTPQQIETILHQLTATRTLPLMQHNRQWHLQLLNGIKITSANDPSQLITLKLLDFSNLFNNDWLVIYSFPVVEANYQHCLDLVIFINGLPLAVFQGLHGGHNPWALRAACVQIQEDQTRLPKFFALNELLVLSNGIQSRIGTLASQWKQFSQIHSTNGENIPFPGETEIETLILNIFDPRRFLEIIQHFIVFRQSRTKLTKKLRSHSFCTLNIPKANNMKILAYSK